MHVHYRNSLLLMAVLYGASLSFGELEETGNSASVAMKDATTAGRGCGNGARCLAESPALPPLVINIRNNFTDCVQIYSQNNRIIEIFCPEDKKFPSSPVTQCRTDFVDVVNLSFTTCPYGAAWPPGGYDPGCNFVTQLIVKGTTYVTCPGDPGYNGKIGGSVPSPGPTPPGSSPVPPTPIGSSPVPPTPIGSSPVPPTPIGSSPVPPTPIGSSPVPPTPIATPGPPGGRSPTTPGVVENGGGQSGGIPSADLTDECQVFNQTEFSQCLTQNCTCVPGSVGIPNQLPAVSSNFSAFACCVNVSSTQSFCYPPDRSGICPSTAQFPGCCRSINVTTAQCSVPTPLPTPGQTFSCDQTMRNVTAACCSNTTAACAIFDSTNSTGASQHNCTLPGGVVSVYTDPNCCSLS